MQFSVYLKGAIPEVAPHRSPRTLAELGVSRGILRKIGQNAVQIVSGASWKDTKALLRGSGKNQPEPINPPGYHCLPYTYPLPIHILEHYQCS